MNANDEAALQLWQANRNNPEIEALFDDFFGRIDAARYECQLNVVREEMASCVPDTKPVFA